MSIKISKSNYEEFMIDYLDGTLSEEREAELLLFLDANPELKAELEGLDEMVLDIDTPVFEFRDGLKKSILDSGKVNTENFEEFCIAFYEGDLMDIEQEHLQNFVHDHPSLVNDFQLFGKLKLSDNQYLQFPYKSNLQQFASTTSEPISESNYLDFLIAQNEGDLTSERVHELQSFLNENSKYKNNAALVASLKLKPDTSIVFENKSMLKRRVVLIPIANKWMNVAAASVAMVVVFYSLIPRQLETGDMPIIQNISTTHASDSLNQADELVEIDTPNNNQDIEETSRITEPTKSSATKTKTHRGRQPSRQIVKVASVSTLACKGIDIQATDIEVNHNISNADIIKMINTGKANAVVDNDKAEKTIELNGYAGKVASRAGRLLSKSDRLKKDRIKGQLRNIADLALEGFNKMTEGDLRLPERNQAPAEDQAPE
jgi:hypothetical protein